MKRFLSFILVAIILSVYNINGYASVNSHKHKRKLNSKPKIYSEAAVLMNTNNGKIIFSKNMHEKLYPASTTKIMTAIVALERGNLNDTVIAGKDAAAAEPSKIGLKAGEKIKLRELLYALMVDSANDAAVAIADHIGGSTKRFAVLMNKKARAIGCNDTHFVNPNGLPNRNHYTSAYDLAIMTKYAMRNSSFRRLVSTVRHRIPATNKSGGRNLTNHNKMLYHTAFYYRGCIGVKTGYTCSAKHTLVSAANRNNKSLIAVILKDPVSPYRGVISMFNYGFGVK